LNREQIIKKGLPYIDGNKFRNTYHFSEAANKFLKDGKYCDFPIKSKDWVDFWVEERRKCFEGVTIGEVTITGYYYFMLNYTPMKIADSNENGAKNITAFPKFWLPHWQLFQIIDYCQKNGQHLGVIKVRGCGFSEIISALGTRDYALVERDSNNNKIFKTIFYYAGDRDYLFGKGVFDLVKKKIDFVNANTQGAMKHLHQVKNTEDERIAGKKTKANDNIQTGGHIAANIVTSPDDVRGGTLNWAILDEGGAFKDSQKAVNILRGNIERSGICIGNLIIGGTANEKVNYIEGLKKMILHPSAYNMVKFRNNWIFPQTEEDILKLENYELDPTKLILPRDSDEPGTGWFIPCYMGQAKFIDKDGNPKVRECIQHTEKERSIMLKGQDVGDATAFFADNPFTIDEALVKTHGREYQSPALSKQLIDVKVKKIGMKVEKGYLHWVKDETDRRSLVGVKFEAHPQGDVEIVLHPDWTEEGNRITYFKQPKIDKLYVSGCDSIDQSDGDSNTLGGSKLAMLVKKRINPNKGVTDHNNIYVALYNQRSRNDVRENWDNALKLTLYYHAMMNLEYTKIGIIQHFERYGFEKYLGDRPTNVNDNLNAKQLRGRKGTQMSTKVLDYGIKKIEEYINDYVENMHIEQHVSQLVEFTRENKSKFDIHAAMLMVEILDDEWRDILARDSNKKEKVTIEYKWEIDPMTGFKRKVRTNLEREKELLNLQNNYKSVDYYDITNQKIVYK
jgi:hypothetical protein